MVITIVNEWLQQCQSLLAALTDSTVPYPAPPYWLIFSRGCPSVCRCLCHLFTASNWIAVGQMSSSLPAWSTGSTVTIVLWQSEASSVRTAQHLGCMWFSSAWGWLGVRGAFDVVKTRRGEFANTSLFVLHCRFFLDFHCFFPLDVTLKMYFLKFSGQFFRRFLKIFLDRSGFYLFSWIREALILSNKEEASLKTCSVFWIYY